VTIQLDAPKSKPNETPSVKHYNQQVTLRQLSHEITQAIKNQIAQSISYALPRMRDAIAFPIRAASTALRELHE